MAWHKIPWLLEAVPGSYSVCVWNTQGEQVFGYNQHVLRSAASLVKVPLAMAVYGDAALACPGVDLDMKVTLQDVDRVEGEGSVDRAPAGTTKPVRDLVGHALRESDNTAANLLIRLVGLDGVRLRGGQDRPGDGRGDSDVRPLHRVGPGRSVLRRLCRARGRDMLQRQWPVHHTKSSSAAV